MKRTAFTLFVLLFLFGVKAQNNRYITGLVYDSADLNPVTDCTLTLVDSNNTVGLSLTNSDKKGKFKLILPKAGIFQLIFTHTGYETRKITIQFNDDNQPIYLGIINLKRLFKQLQDIIITEKFQSSIKGDTIIFNTNELITKPYVTLEGILNKLPGFQLQRDGSIMAMGTIVQKIFVDGQEFFANDPRLATRNITADMIDQIQVYEDKSEQAKFSKIDDGIRIKTINIKLKKDKAKGDFGRITAAPATENRYEAGIFVNHFRAKSRISLTATSGNSNKNSYSFISQNSGNASGNEQDNQNNAFSQSTPSVLHAESINPGMLKINKTSISYNDEWSPKIKITGNYSFVNNENILEQTSNRYNQFPNDSSSEVLKQFKTQTINYQHVLNARLEYKINASSAIHFLTGNNLQNGNSYYFDSTSSFSKAIFNYLAIEGKTMRMNKKESFLFNHELLFRHSFRKRGRTLIVKWRNGRNSIFNNEEINTPLKFYKPDGSILLNRDLNRLNKHQIKNINNQFSGSYSEPLGKNKIAGINLEISEIKGASIRDVFDYRNTTSQFDSVNFPLSNQFKNENLSGRIGFNFQQQFKKLNYQIGFVTQATELKSKLKNGINAPDTILKQQLINYFPSASLFYSLGPGKNIRIYYSGRTYTPGTQELQDVIDYSNPLQLKRGNPNLKQELSNLLTVTYNLYNSKTYRNFNLNFSINSSYLKIVNSIDSVENNVVIMMPVNLNGSYNTSFIANAEVPVHKLKGGKFIFTVLGFYANDVSLIYKVKNYTRSLILDQSVQYRYSKKRMELGLKGKVIYNKIDFTIQKNLSNRYVTQIWSADGYYKFNKNFFLYSECDWFLNSSNSGSLYQNNLVWNMATAKHFLKNNRAELKLIVFDILNKSIGLKRIVSENSFEDVRSVAIGRVLMLSFTYNFNYKVK